MVETEKLKSAIPVRVEDGDALGHPPNWAQDPAYHGMTGPAVKITVRDNDSTEEGSAPAGRRSPGPHPWQIGQKRPFGAILANWAVK